MCYAPLLTHFIAHNEKCPETSHDDDVLCVLRFFVIMNMSEPPASTQSVDNKAFWCDKPQCYIGYALSDKNSCN